MAIVGVENALVRHPAADIVGVAALAVIDGVPGRRARVLREPVEQRDFAIALAHQRVAQQVRDRQRAQGADGIDKQRVRPVEGVDVAAAIGGRRPAGGLHGAGAFQRQLVVAAFPGILEDAAFGHEAEQVPVGADVVEAVVVNAGVGEVRRHQRDGPVAADIEELALAGGVELEN